MNKPIQTPFWRYSPIFFTTSRDNKRIYNKVPRFFPLWNEYYFGGTSFLGFPGSYTICLLTVFVLIAPTALGAVKWIIIFGIFFAGLTMYLLVSYLIKNQKAVLIADIIYMFNGNTLISLHWG